MCLTIRYWARCGRVVDGVLCENQSSNGTNTEDVPEPCEDFKARNGGKAVFGSPHCPNHELRHAPKQGVPCKQCKRVLDNAKKRAQNAEKRRNKPHGDSKAVAGPSRALASSPEAQGSSEPRTHPPPPPVEIGGWDDYTPSTGGGKGTGKMK